MLDSTALASWIKPQHLEDSTLGAYRESFNAHPSRMTVLEDFLLDDVAEKLSLFLRTEGEFRPEYGLYSVEDDPVDEATWSSAPDDDRFFRYGKLVGTPPEFLVSPNALSYLQFRHAFGTEPFKAFFEHLSGLELSSKDDFGAHLMGPGDFLRPHSDDNRDRRLAIVIYLTPGWQPEQGGALHVVKEGAEETIVPAAYNSIVVFDVLADTLHYVEPIAATSDAARATIGGWYHKPNGA
jgi:2OG-Fe(II) oxygenase superfamily